MIAKEDKDKQIEFLKESLMEVKAKVEDVLVNKAGYADIVDFIDKRLADVTY